jgi:hypothetical protein
MSCDPGTPRLTVSVTTPQTELQENFGLQSTIEPFWRRVAAGCDAQLDIAFHPLALAEEYQAAGRLYSGAQVHGTVRLTTTTTTERGFHRRVDPPACVGVGIACGSGSEDPRGAPFDEALLGQGSFLSALFSLLGSAHGHDFLLELPLVQGDRRIRSSQLDAISRISDTAAIPQLAELLFTYDRKRAPHDYDVNGFGNPSEDAAAGSLWALMRMSHPCAKAAVGYFRDGPAWYEFWKKQPRLQRIAAESTDHQ